MLVWPEVVGYRALSQVTLLTLRLGGDEEQVTWRSVFFLSSQFDADTFRTAFDILKRYSEKRLNDRNIRWNLFPRASLILIQTFCGGTDKPMVDVGRIMTRRVLM
jgi:hypothetical protein